MKYTAENLQQLDSVKGYLKNQLHDQGVKVEVDQITDQVAIDYSLGLTVQYFQDLYKQPKKRTLWGKS